MVLEEQSRIADHEVGCSLWNQTTFSVKNSKSIRSLSNLPYSRFYGSRISPSPTKLVCEEGVKHGSPENDLWGAIHYDWQLVASVSEESETNKTTRRYF